MGKLTRIRELEAEVAWWRKSAAVNDDIEHFLNLLAEMPEDAVLTYQLTGQKVHHDFARAARVLLAKVKCVK